MGVQGFELPVYQGFPYKPNKISAREELSHSERMENGGENKECRKRGKSKKTSLALAPFSTRPECENSSSRPNIRSAHTRMLATQARL